MINLFHFPHHLIDTSKYSNLLHDKVVREFEEKFAEYVGAKYAVSLNSATSAIFLIFKNIIGTVSIPSIIPPVVPNALINAGCTVSFTNNTDWVGGMYEMFCHARPGFFIYDSAQQVERNQFTKYAEEDDLMIFSFYPSKPIGSCDGGMVVSNKPLDGLREASFNGMSFAENNWDRKINSIGHKMYMSSIQADMAMDGLRRLDEKQSQLAYVRNLYNTEFGLKNTSSHLYRVKVHDNKAFVAKAKEAGIVCGIHYEALHTHRLYISGQTISEADEAARTMVSIPFHEMLTRQEIDTVIKFVNENRNA